MSKAGKKIEQKKKTGFPALALALMIAGMIAGAAGGAYFARRGAERENISKQNAVASTQASESSGADPLASPGLSGDEIRNETFRRLDGILATKKEQLSLHISNIDSNASAVSGDADMLKGFQLLGEFHRLKKISPPPEDAARSIGQLAANIRELYLREYQEFYDILFVNNEGDIFFTIRQQADYNKNVFDGDFAETALGKALAKRPGKTFVDYQNYKYSDEPSAFFIIPAEIGGKREGWVVFQCSVNKINNLFTEEKELGRTGEVFLVNKQKYMLTDSRFYGDSSVLKKQLSPANIDSKFKERRGHKIVVDYRGRRALSSFEVYEIGGSEWLIIAKIDEDEVITDLYKKRKDLREKLAAEFVGLEVKSCDLKLPDRKMTQVDMDEFRKAKSGEDIGTFGVSTCTAIMLSSPGDFTYLAHASNMDVVYGGHSTNLVDGMLHKIRTFDMYMYDVRNLEALIVANHTDSVMNIVDRLVSGGLMLSQIRFAFNPGASYATLRHNTTSNQTAVDWLVRANTVTRTRQCGSDPVDLGEMVKQIAGYDE